MKRLLTWTGRHLSSPSRTLLTVVAILFLMVFLLDTRIRAQIVRGSFPDEWDKYYLPPPQYMRIASMGYREAAADLVWVAAVQHAADRKLYGGTRFPWLEKYLDTVLELNPYLRKVYSWADGTLTYGRGHMTNQDWRRSIHYLKKGHRHFPRDWELLFKLACAFTELRSEDPQQRTRWLRLAANYLWKAHLVGGGPPWLGSLAARYWSEEGQWLLAYRKTLEEFTATDDPKVRREMGDRLATLLSRSAGGMTMVEHFARLALPAAGNPAATGAFLVGDTLRRQRLVLEATGEVAKVAARKEQFDRIFHRCLPYGSSDLFVLLGDCQRLDPSAARDASDLGHTP